MGYSVKAAQPALNRLVGVRIPVPQFKTAFDEKAGAVFYFLPRQAAFDEKAGAVFLFLAEISGVRRESGRYFEAPRQKKKRSKNEREDGRIDKRIVKGSSGGEQQAVSPPTTTSAFEHNLSPSWVWGRA